MSIYKSQGKWRIITIIIARNFNITLSETDRPSNYELVRCRRRHNTVNKLDSTGVCVCVCVCVCLDREPASNRESIHSF